jgi:hypothetical protein
MLADSRDALTKSGTLGREVLLPATSLNELLEFIRAELPRWRDRPDRRHETSETTLTSQLCAHLNSAARHSDGWDFLQFRTEVPDEAQKGRKIDLAASPCDTTVCVEGRRHTDFDTILPIECKRLPTPKEKDRDEREYVINRHASTGGIQRFKAGHHAAAHKLGAMIGYVQEDTAAIWGERVGEWIKDLVESGQPGWTAKDFLHLEHHDATQRMAVLRSLHSRDHGLQDIELRHLWLNMN